MGDWEARPARYVWASLGPRGVDRHWKIRDCSERPDQGWGFESRHVRLTCSRTVTERAGRLQWLALEAAKLAGRFRVESFL